jgi:hypothetical protein
MCLHFSHTWSKSQLDEDEDARWVGVDRFGVADSDHPRDPSTRFDFPQAQESEGTSWKALY